MASYLSEVKIYNMALGHVGADNTVDDPNERSPEAKQCKLWYDSSRVEVLEAFNWSFARTRLDLALAADDAPLEWLYRYQYPSNCVKAREIFNPFGSAASLPSVFCAVPTQGNLGGSLGNAIPFTIQMAPSNGSQRTILTNMPSAELIYTFDQKDPGTFSQWFAETLSHLIASRIAMKITGKSSLRKDEQNAYALCLIQAPAHDAEEGIPDMPREAEFVRGR